MVLIVPCCGDDFSIYVERFEEDSALLECYLKVALICDLAERQLRFDILLLGV